MRKVSFNAVKRTPAAVEESSEPGYQERIDRKITL